MFTAGVNQINVTVITLVYSQLPLIYGGIVKQSHE